MTTKRLWLKFQFLDTGESFSIGTGPWVKVGYITAESLWTGERKTILPFRRVHSFRLIQTSKSELDKRASDMELPAEPPVPTPVRPPRLPAPTNISEFIRQHEEENPGNQTVIPGDHTPTPVRPPEPANNLFTWDGKKYIGEEKVIPGDRTPAARGGSELTPSA